MQTYHPPSSSRPNFTCWSLCYPNTNLLPSASASSTLTTQSNTSLFLPGTKLLCRSLGESFTPWMFRRHSLFCGCHFSLKLHAQHGCLYAFGWNVMRTLLVNNPKTQEPIMRAPACSTTVNLSEVEILSLWITKAVLKQIYDYLTCVWWSLVIIWSVRGRPYLY